MKNVIKILGLSAYLIIFGFYSANGQWKACGPYGGQCHSITADGDNVYVGTFGGGIFHSTNKGQTWSSMNNGVFPSFIPAILIKGDSVYFGDENNLYVSQKHGTQWYSKDVGSIYENILDIKKSENHTFVGTTKGFYISSDNGNEWIQKNSGLNNTYINIIAVDGNDLFVGTRNGVFYSSDMGDNWSERDKGLDTLFISDLYANEGYIYSVTLKGTVFSSADKGLNWKNISDSSKYFKIVTLSSNEKFLFAGSKYGYVFASTNKGDKWAQLNQSHISNIYSLDADGEYVFAATGDGVYISSNNGADWSFMSEGICNLFISSLLSVGDDLFAGIQNKGVFACLGEECEWNDYGDSLKDFNIFVNCLAADEDRLYAGTSGGFVMKEAAGKGWKKSADSLYVQINSLCAFDGKVFAGTHSDGVFFSSDKGVHWTATDSVLKGDGIFSLAAKDGIVYAASPQKGIYSSQDNGLNWQNIENNMHDYMNPKYFYTLALDDINIYAGGNMGVLYYSSDKGGYWNEIEPGLKDATIKSICTKNGNLFIGTDKGVYLSADKGGEWYEANKGLLNLDVYSLAINGDYLYAGTFGNSVLKAKIDDLLKITGVCEGTLSRSYDIIDLYSIYPNPMNGSCRLKFYIKNEGNVYIDMADVYGRKVKVIYSGIRPSGENNISINAENLPSGLYFVRAAAFGVTKSLKMTVIK